MSETEKYSSNTLVNSYEHLQLNTYSTLVKRFSSTFYA